MDASTVSRRFINAIPEVQLRFARGDRTAFESFARPQTTFARPGCSALSVDSQPARYWRWSGQVRRSARITSRCSSTDRHRRHDTGQASARPELRLSWSDRGTDQVDCAAHCNGDRCGGARAGPPPDRRAGRGPSRGGGRVPTPIPGGLSGPYDSFFTGFAQRIGATFTRAARERGNRRPKGVSVDRIIGRTPLEWSDSKDTGPG
jgi:hypothetical protein